MNTSTDTTALLESQFQGRFFDATFSRLELAAIDWLDGFYQLNKIIKDLI